MKSLSEGLIESGLSTLDGMRLNMLSIDGISLSFPRVVCEGFLISLLLGAVLIPLIIDNFAGGSGMSSAPKLNTYEKIKLRAATPP